MTLTDYHAKYFAHELTKRCSSDSLEKLAGAVAGAQVDLNPHQVDAALFAFHSPLSKGALLADEVGLGKTIEAGLVISQKWAERKRTILVIVPVQSSQAVVSGADREILPALPASRNEVLQRGGAGRAISGHSRPRTRSSSAPTSLPASKAADVANTAWDLVVIDEAHRLRNVYKPTNIIANTLKQALQECHKLLLTATPLQNSLLELFGLVSFIDEHAFGDLKSFREQFANLSQEQVFRHSEEPPQADLPSHAAATGHRLHPVHQAACRFWKSSPRRKAKTGSTNSSRNTCAATTFRRFPPASAR